MLARREVHIKASDPKITPTVDQLRGLVVLHQGTPVLMKLRSNEPADRLANEGVKLLMLTPLMMEPSEMRLWYTEPMVVPPSQQKEESY